MEWRQDHPEVCHRVPELGNVGRHLKFVGIFMKLEREEGDTVLVTFGHFIMKLIMGL